MVEWCDRPVGDGYVCQRCADKLSVALGDVPALWEELDTVLTKQARYADPEGRGNDPALMFNTQASEIGWALRNTLSTWCRLIAEERGKPLPAPRKFTPRHALSRHGVVVADVAVRCGTTFLPVEQCDGCRTGRHVDA
jgi:hypothetical protein